MVRLLMSVVVWPRLQGYRLACLLFGEQRAFLAASESIARRPGLWGIYLRQAFYRQVLDEVGEDVHFGFMTLLSKPRARIGRRVYLGRLCTIGWADIGDDVMLADGVQILSGGRQHGAQRGAASPTDDADADDSAGTLRDNPQHFERVKIGAGAWLGANAVVMADVGAHAIVAAGAVVTKPVPAGAVVGGVPAKVLRGAGENDQ